ncbi:hypothetical protein FF38_09802 [Lucilia cuprina]|uniref:CRAL-TRIO domain-containing protein n=1 Tax=Lucilia cuprina TaxID=7375 RepID=A0A0L0BR04_LUCCU|nr:hypothetical protein FF38_09802 [Lucilia cuprina]
MPNIRPLPPCLQKVAIEELNEDPSRIEADLQTLKTWIEQQPHLKARTDDQFLVAFLRGCKYSLEKTKSKIDKYYMLRSKYPEMFALRDVDEVKIREILKMGFGVVLPTPLNETGPRIMLVRNGIYDPHKYDFMDIMRVGQAFNEILMWEDDYAIVNGFVHIADLKDWSKEHFFQATPSVMKKITVYSEEAMPLRPKASHIINAPSIFESVFNIFKPMMSEKQLNRMTIYGSNIEKMYEKIPLKYLPKEYGGENGSIPEILAEWEQKFLSYRDYFIEDAKYGTDEQLRPGKPIDFDNLFGMEAKLALKAQEELGEKPERIDDDIKALREWIQKQPHLKARTDDQLLVAFLRGCKYSLEKAKQKIDSFYAMRNAVPELYKNRFVDDKAIAILRQGCLLRLPKPLSEDGPRIHISRYGLYDTDKFSLTEVVKVGTMLGEIQFREDDNAMVMGFLEVIDLKGVAAGHIFQFDAVLVKKLAVLGDKAWPYRPKGFHFVNAPSGTEKLLSIAKSLMSEKIKQRFHIHSKYESLYDYIPQECLPAEYGGSNGTVQDVINTWEKKLLDYKSYFDEEVQYCTNEKLRPGRPVNSESLFGIEGSFRKLDID